MATLSDASWCDQFPGSSSVDDLVDPFKTNVNNFLAALNKAKASVSIQATYRPPERAFLMHYSYLVSNGTVAPSAVPKMNGVDIDWVHKDAKGNVDLEASKKAASDMVAKYEIAYAPALASRHTEKKAIDMDISWGGDLTIDKVDKTSTTIKSNPRTGDNTDLQAVGKGYGVIKLATDPPHWSSDGH